MPVGCRHSRRRSYTGIMWEHFPTPLAVGDKGTSPYCRLVLSAYFADGTEENHN